MPIRHAIRLVLPLISVVVLVASAASASEQSLRERINSEPDFQIYTVIFGITVTTNSTVPTVRLAKVTDPILGTTAAVMVDVPDEYVQAVKTRIEAKHYEPKLKDGKPVEFFTYFFYVPGHSEIVIVDLDRPLDKQP